MLTQAKSWMEYPPPSLMLTLYPPSARPEAVEVVPDSVFTGIVKPPPA
jgi:hypothetical protein